MLRFLLKIAAFDSREVIYCTRDAEEIDVGLSIYHNGQINFQSDWFCFRSWNMVYSETGRVFYSFYPNLSVNATNDFLIRDPELGSAQTLLGERIRPSKKP